MSATASIGERLRPRTQARPAEAGSWAAFCLLSVYGTLRWATMLQAPDQGRLLLALGLAVLNAVALRHLPRQGHRDWTIPVLCVVDLVLILLISGFGSGAVIGGHLGRLVSELSTGMSAVPGVLVPYRGHNPATVATIALGASALLLCGGLAFGNVRGRPATGQLLLAALPLLALTIVPSAIVRPKLAFLHGLITFTLVTLLVLSPRLTPRRRGGGTVLLLSAAILGAILALTIAGTGRPWLSVATGHLIGGAGSGVGGPERFEWTQGDGPLGPASAATVMTVRAARPAYWKSEDLDDFNGHSWVLSPGADPGLSDVSRVNVARYSENIQVDVTDLESTEIFGAGYTDAPWRVGASPGAVPGTWTIAPPLRPGSHYTETVYFPTPPLGALADAGTDYPSDVASFRALSLPGSGYAGVRTLARRLQAGTSTPIAYVEAVLDYLRDPRRFTYTRHPPRGGRDPLASFLLSSHRGYCQQFAGAMALLLRLGGVPARVAVGFSSGSAPPGSDRYTVTGRDAHAWVEAWFPGYGWVTFDPTPGSTSATGVGGAGGLATAQPTPPADATTFESATSQLRGISATKAKHSSAASGHTGAGRRSGHRSGSGSGGGVPVIPILLALAAVGVLGWLIRRAPGWLARPSTTDLTAELERAFARCGDPLGPAVTLAVLRSRLRDSPAAADYVAALSSSRYAAVGEHPTGRGRAALRRHLAAGGGPLRRLRAWRALPPRRWA